MQMYWLYGFANQNDSEPTLGFFVIADDAADAIVQAKELPIAKGLGRIVEHTSKPLPPEVPAIRRVAGAGPHNVSKTIWDWSISN